MVCAKLSIFFILLFCHFLVVSNFSLKNSNIVFFFLFAEYTMEVVADESDIICWIEDVCYQYDTTFINIYKTHNHTTFLVIQ